MVCFHIIFLLGMEVIWLYTVYAHSTPLPSPLSQL